MTITNKQWQDDVALHRYQMIAPLLSEDLDNAKRVALRKKIAADNNTTIRSLYRYEAAYKAQAFTGLRPVDREKRHTQSLPKNFEELLLEAIQLRREVPERSVAQIILILELENRVAPGVLKRSTLERHLHKAGFGTEHLRIYKEARESSSKRFCKPHRMMLVQGDIKYGPILPIGKNGAKVKTYLSSAIDDHSRYVIASKFYANQEEAIVEDTFHTVLLRAGKFDNCYFDNGSQYIAKQIKISLSKLGIRVSHAPVRSGKSKGKVEKFHQVVDKFIREVKLKPVKTLDELNRWWTIYLEEYYHKVPHEGIAEYYQSLNSSVPPEGITPLQEWNRDSRELCFIDVSVVAEAFLHHERRRVDKGACIQFRGRRYETTASLIGQYVEIAYDPLNPIALTISHPSVPTFIAQPLKIGAYCNQKTVLPAAMQTAKPMTSRLLDGLEARHNETKAMIADAISFADYGKEGQNNV